MRPGGCRGGQKSSFQQQRITAVLKVDGVLLQIQ